MSVTKFGFAQANGGLYGIQAKVDTEEVVQSLRICDLTAENIDVMIEALQEVKAKFNLVDIPKDRQLH